MKLATVNKGTKVTITAIEADKELKQRFNAFGLTKGATVFVECYTLAKQTMKVRINNTRMALRLSEAQKVSVTQ